MKVENIHTGEVSEVNFNTWRGKNNKTSFRILERGDTVYLRDIRNLPDVKYLFEIDRDHAIRMLKNNSNYFDFEEISELPFEVTVLRILTELSWKKDRKADISELFSHLKIELIPQDLKELANYFEENGYAKLTLWKGGGEIFLTLKGKQLVSENKEIELNEDLLIESKYSEPQNKSTKMIKVFVTYSWDSEEHKNKVLSFADFLRKNGFEATLDRKISQEESAPNFTKMMHQIMTDYDKVIVVLSKGYKKKADSFSGGVGTEYQLIISDINDYPQKYILVTFDDIDNEILPLSFKGRQVIELKDDDQRQTLFAKLQDVNLINFSPVAENLPELATTPIPDFESLISKEKQFVKIIQITSYPLGGSHKLYGKYFETHHGLRIEYENISNKILSGIRIEVVVAKEFADYSEEGTVTSQHKIFSVDYDKKVYPNQQEVVELGHLVVKNTNAEKAFNESLTVKFYSELGNEVIKYPLKQFLVLAADYSRARKIELTIDNYHDKHVRK